MPTPCNVLNITTAGIVVFDGTSAFSADTTTNHAILVGSTSNGITSVGPSGTAGQILQSAGAAADPTFSTATYPATTTVSQILYSSSTNVVGGITTGNNGLLVTSNTGVPSILAGPGTTGNILQSNAAAAPSFSTATFPSTATSTGTILRANGTNWVASTSTYPDTNAVSTLLYASSANVMAALTTANNGLLVTSNTGVPSILAGPGATGKVLQSNSAAAPSFSTATYPATATGTGTLLRADGTNWVASTSTYPDTNAVSTLLYASSANVMAALATANDGVLVTSHTGVPSILAGPGAAGKVLQSNAAAAPSYSTPTYPSTSGTSRKILVSDGTNNVYSTETWAVPGTSGNVLTSDGTNWTSAAPASSGGTIVTTYNLADSPATWTKNANTKWIKLYMWGGGSGGGSGRKGTTAASSGGAGGTSGQFIVSEGPASYFTSPATVTIGRGGVGGLAVSTNSTNGNVGDGVTAATNTTFGTWTALKGTGGTGGNTTARTGLSALRSFDYTNVGNLTSSSILSGDGNLTAGGASTDLSTSGPSCGGGGGGGDTTTARAGGKGGDIFVNHPTTVAGGTAGTADGGTGGNGNASSTFFYSAGTGGGGGGGCKTVNAGAGGNGAVPGGGGGGGGGGVNAVGNSGAGGDGAAGRVIIIEYT